MSRRHKIKYLSSDELKSKLYAHFQKTGSLDHLRAQLRGQLVSELFKVAEPIDVDKFPDASDVDKCLLPIQVCNWLIYDHLSRQDYQYSLSTFVTEAQLPYPEKFLTAGDILTLLGLDHNTSEFVGISKLYSEKNELDYLHSLLLAILKTLFNISMKDKVLNQSHNQERELNESQIRNGNDQDLNQSFIKDKESVFEASFRDEFSKSKDHALDRSFQSNFDIKSTELSFQEQLQSVKKESEREVQKLRHKLLEELENLHSQEHKMQLEVEFTKSELKREQYKLIKEKELLKEKEVLLEKEIANKYEMKMRDAESEFATKLHSKDKEIQFIKAKLTEKEQKLTHVETELSSEKDNQTLMKRELEDLKHMYKIIQDKYSAVLDENTNLLRKFENMSDYSILKEELSSKTTEVLRLQNEIRDIHHRSEVERKKYVETVRNLEENLKMKEPQLIQTRRELEQLQNTLTSEKSLWNKERKRLEQELSEFKELHKTVIEKMEDQKEEVQNLQQTIHVLNYKLTNNVINLTKSESVRPYKSIHTSARTSLKSNTENLFAKSSAYLQPSNEKYDDSSMKFLSDAKNRCGKLKQEENVVQEKYSYTVSSIPDFNNQTHSYLGNYSVSARKSNFESYGFTPLSKSANVNSSFHLNNWTKNKMASDMRSSYSLNDVKRMVSNSLFSHKSRNHIDSLTLIGNADMSSTAPNILNSNFKDIRQTSEMSLPFSTNIHSSFSISNDNVTTLHTGTSKNHRKELSTEHSNQFSPHVAESDFSTPSQAENSHSQQLCDSVVLESKDQDPVKNSKKAPTQKQNDLVKGNVDNSEHSQLESKSTEKNLPEELSRPSIHADENTVSLSSVPRSIDSQSKSIVLENSKSASLYSGQEISDNKLLEKTKSKPESSSLFVNLDAAWKERSLDPLLPSRSKSVTTEIKSDNPVVSSYLLNEDTSMLKNSTIYTTIKDTSSSSNLPMEKTSTTIDEKVTEINPEIASNKQITLGSKATEMTSNKQMTESSKAAEVTSSKQIIEDSEATDPKDTSLNELDKHIEHDDKINQIDKDEKQSEKSVEKIPSADSLSELSDVHLSCGSEAEQLKEDSDAW